VGEAVVFGVFPGGKYHGTDLLQNQVVITAFKLLDSTFNDEHFPLSESAMSDKVRYGDPEIVNYYIRTCVSHLRLKTQHAAAGNISPPLTVHLPPPAPPAQPQLTPSNASSDTKIQTCQTCGHRRFGPGALSTPCHPRGQCQVEAIEYRTPPCLCSRSTSKRKKGPHFCSLCTCAHCDI
jgi:hypothetical protein